MIKGIIFDLDGTTLSTIEDITDSLNDALNEYGIEVKSTQEAMKNVGSGYLKLVQAFAPDSFSQEKVKEMADRYRDIYAQNYSNKTRPYPGIVELLEKLQKKGIQLAVNSNKSDSSTKGLINKYFPGITFVEVFGAREGVKHKPDPQAANEIAQLMGLNKDEILYIGDSETDIQTAKNAGMKSVGCLWGYRDRETLENSKADIIVEKAEEILNYL